MTCLLLLCGTGCSTIGKGTSRKLLIESEVPGAVASINNRVPVTLPTKLTLNTRRDRGPIQITARAPDGRQETQTLNWQMKDGKWFLIGGGVGWGVTTGIGGLVSMGVDYATKAYNDLETEKVVFGFRNQPTVQAVVQCPPGPLLSPVPLPPSPPRAVRAMSGTWQLPGVMNPKR